MIEGSAFAASCPVPAVTAFFCCPPKARIGLVAHPHAIGIGA
jgi:hypothetical protein